MWPAAHQRHNWALTLICTERHIPGLAKTALWLECTWWMRESQCKACAMFRFLSNVLRCHTHVNMQVWGSQALTCIVTSQTLGQSEASPVQACSGGQSWCVLYVAATDNHQALSWNRKTAKQTAVWEGLWTHVVACVW